MREGAFAAAFLLVLVLELIKGQRNDLYFSIAFYVGKRRLDVTARIYFHTCGASLMGEGHVWQHGMWVRRHEYRIMSHAVPFTMLKNAC